MKYPKWLELGTKLQSPPSRGAWIEIHCSPKKSCWTWKSPPSRGAWIEITPLPQRNVTRIVAPLAGGVD